mgnify:FL=1|jgi:hypothetical protein
MSKKPTTHGGARKGAGRKSGSGKGRTYVPKTVAMSEESWDKLDRQRGDQSRGKYIESILPDSGGGQKYELAMEFKANKIHLIPL